VIKINPGVCNMRNRPGFMDLRQWIELLEREASCTGSPHRLDIGTVSHKVLERKGPALGPGYRLGERPKGSVDLDEDFPLLFWRRHFHSLVMLR
jgi:hypothetical protein